MFPIKGRIDSFALLDPEVEWNLAARAELRLKKEE